MTPLEIQEIADKAAEKAIRQFFLTLGVNAADSKAVLAMQADFKHLRTWRESVETVRRHSIKAAATVLVTGVLGYVLLIFGFKVGS